MGGKIKNIIQALIILLSVTVFGQIPDSTYIITQYQKILSSKREGNFEKAYKVNINLLNNLIDDNYATEDIAQCYIYKSSIEVSLGKYSESINSAHKALHLFTTINDSIKMASS